MHATAEPITFRDLPPYGIRGDYQRPHTTLTLREGLAEYYRVNPGLSEPAHLTDAHSATYFHNHDCTHVIFGTHTGDLDEAANDMLTLFGVDITAREYAGGFLATTEAEDIAKNFVMRSLAVVLWQTVRLLPALWRRTRQMPRRWPWNPPDAYLDRPLSELRAEFGIVPFRPDEELGLTREPQPS